MLAHDEGVLPIFAPVVTFRFDERGAKIFADSGPCSKSQGKTLWRLDAAGSNQWVQIPGPGGSVGAYFGVFAVSPSNPSFLGGMWLASKYGGGLTPYMVYSRNGGRDWNYARQLDKSLLGDPLLSGQPLFVDQAQVRYQFPNYYQPDFFAFDPGDPNVMVAGGQDAGLVISTDGGEDWVPLVPRGSGTIGRPERLTKPFQAYFDHDAGTAARRRYPQ